MTWTLRFTVLAAALGAAPAPAFAQAVDTVPTGGAQSRGGPVSLLTGVEARARWHQDPSFPGSSYRRSVLVARLGLLLQLSPHDGMGASGFAQIATDEGDIVGGPELMYQRRLSDRLAALAAVAWIDPGGDDDHSALVGILYRGSIGITAGVERRSWDAYDGDRAYSVRDDLPFVGLATSGRLGRYGYAVTAAGAAIAGLLWWLVAS